MCIITIYDKANPQELVSPTIMILNLLLTKKLNHVIKY